MSKLSGPSFWLAQTRTKDECSFNVPNMIKKASVERTPFESPLFAAAKGGRKREIRAGWLSFVSGLDAPRLWVSTSTSPSPSLPRTRSNSCTQRRFESSNERARCHFAGAGHDFYIACFSCSLHPTPPRRFYQQSIPVCVLLISSPIFPFLRTPSFYPDHIPFLFLNGNYCPWRRNCTYLWMVDCWKNLQSLDIA